ncbi:MAG: hypothetical protein LC798_19360 [Chloroflexi bacterium]|nr:hypothetical protein [Chloroflexota bacterium]
MPFEIRFEGHTWKTEDLTLDEAIRIEQVTGRSWLRINPFAYGKDAAEVIAMFLSRDGEDFNEARARVGKLRTGDIIDCFHIVPEDLPDTYQDGNPLAAEGPATAGSFPALDDLDGPQT